jgi:hypothetical protein
MEVKVKVPLSLYLTMYQAIKTYPLLETYRAMKICEGVEVLRWR